MGLILLPGVQGQRTARRSSLAFYWHARDCDLDAITGQAGNLTSSMETVAGPVTPGVGSTLSVSGRAFPRFGRFGNLNALETAGVTSGQNHEWLFYPFAVRAVDQTLLMRITGLWTPGSSIAECYVCSLGESDLGAGMLRVYRTSTYWQLLRTRGTTASSSNLTENAALTWPADILVQYVGSTGIGSLYLRSASGTIYGPVTAGGGSYIFPTLRWGGERFWMNCDGYQAKGAPMRIFQTKIAYGIKSFTDMDAAA